jgi:PAS domain S-box-containing protein
MIPILLVDDEPALLEIAKIFIEREGGYEVTACSSAFEAIKILENSRFTVIISDYEMPAMDGIEFLKKIREKGNYTPFIIFTGRGREQVVIEALNYGADFYLQKGGDPKSQFAELRNMVQQASKRTEAEEAVRQSERRLYEIINFLPDATFAIDREGKVIAWNRAIEEMTEIPAGDMLGKGDMAYSLPFYGKRRKILVDFLFEKDEDSIGNYYKNIVRNGHGIIAETEVTFLHKEPTILWAKATPFYDEDNNVIGAVESIRDITDLRRYEETITGGKNRFQELAEQLPQGVYEIDLQGSIMYANQRTLDIFGYPRNSPYRSYNIFRMLVPDEHERARQGVRATIEGRRIFGNIYTGVKYDGTTFLIWIFSSPIVTDDKVTGIRGTIVDLSEIDVTDDRVRESSGLFRSLVENVPDGIGIVDWDGNILFANKAARELAGRPPGDVKTVSNIFDLVEPGFKEMADRDIVKIKQGESVLRDYLMRTVQGSLRWVEVRGRLTVFKGRNAAILTIRDITHKKEEEETRRVRAEARIRYQKALLDIAKLDLTDLCHVIHEMIRTDAHMLGVSRVSYWEFDQDRKGIVCCDRYLAGSGLYESGARLEIAAYPSYLRALNEMRLISSDDVREHPGLGEMFQDYLEPEGITSMMDVPVWYNGTMMGILCHEHTGPRRAWTDIDREFATSVADHISLAIETSKRRQIEEALNESEATSRALINATHDLAMLTLSDGTVIDANLMASGTLSGTDLNLPGKNIFSILPGEVAQFRREWADRSIQTGKVVQFTDEYDGRIFETTIYPVRDPGGTINRLAMFSRDITEQRRNAALLEERERFLSNIFESIQDGISVIDADMRIVRINPVIEEWFGHAMPVIGKKCYEVYHSRDEQCASCPSRTNLETRKSSCEIVPKHGKDGLITGWLELYSFPLIDSRTDSVSGVIDYARDISERKEAEDALHRSEERLKVAIEGGDICTWEYDVQSRRIVRVNEKWHDIFGYQPGEMNITLDELAVLIHPDDKVHTTESISDLIEGRTSNLDTETRLKCSDGTYKWILVRGKTVRDDPEGKALGIAGTIQDISEMRKYRDIIEISNRKLYLLNSVTRHDLQNQLTILNGALDLAKTGTAGELAEYLAMAEKTAVAMTKMISFTREYQDIGVREPIWQEVDEVARHAAGSLHSDKVSIDIHVGTVRIFSDRLLEKVFYNLFDNALRHGGEPLTTIQVLAREDESGLVITVEDDGIGITRKDKENIFERGIGQNTGLGLFLVREILSITGIAIREIGTPGTGARFEISVPGQCCEFPGRETTESGR